MFESLSKASGVTFNREAMKKSSRNGEKNVEGNKKKRRLDDIVLKSPLEEKNSLEKMQQELIDLQRKIDAKTKPSNEKNDLLNDHIDWSLSMYEQHQFPMRGHTSYLLFAIAPSHKF